MDPMPGEQSNHEVEEYGGPKEMQYYGGGAISAPTGDELIGADNDDQYDELYGDLDVGEGLAIAPDVSHEAQALNLGFSGSTPVSQNTGIDPLDILGKVGDESVSLLQGDELIDEDDDHYDDLYGDLDFGEDFLKLQLSESPDPCANGAINGGLQTPNTIFPEPTPVNSGGVPLTDPKDQIASEMVPVVSNFEAINTLQKEIAPDVSHDAQALNLGFRGSTPVAQNTGIRQIPDDNPIRATGDNGATRLFVGELHWWTTDVEIESVSSKYGKVKEVKFVEQKVNGKSRGYCHVEFYDSAAAAACKNGMNGYHFNGRACTVAFTSPHTIRQMGDFYMNKFQVHPQSRSEFYMNKLQVQPQSPFQPQGRRPLNDSAGRRGKTNYPAGDSGSGYGRGWWARGQGGGGNRGDGHMRGIRANYEEGMGARAFGSSPDGFMHPQGMIGAEFDPTYKGRGFPGPAFRGIMPPFRNVDGIEISGVSPHVNPASFGRGTAGNGMGMMGNAKMDGRHSGMRNDTNAGGWGQEHGQRTRESSFGGEDGDPEYGYSSHDKGPKSNAVSRGKKRGSESDCSGNFDKRHRDHDRERSDREHRYMELRYREEKDDYRKHRQGDRYLAYKDDRDRGKTSARSRSRSRVREEDYRSRSRDDYYGKRRRRPSP